MEFGFGQCDNDVVRFLVYFPQVYSPRAFNTGQYIVRIDKNTFKENSRSWNRENPNQRVKQ